MNSALFLESVGAPGGAFVRHESSASSAAVNTCVINQDMGRFERAWRPKREQVCGSVLTVLLPSDPSLFVCTAAL